ncbi:unnamed protein product, partial [Rotaria magnacalcarata]
YSLQKKALLLFEQNNFAGLTATGINCNTSNSSCDLLKPCQNHGTCINTQTDNDCYVCLCATGFNGTHCEFDHRPCKSQTCLGHGECHETLDLSFFCLCHDGWTGVHCESMINFCDNFTCLNNGTCRSSSLNYTCCSPPSVRLAMELNSLLHPTKVRRNGEFYISAYIELFCIKSIEAVSQWTIINCTTSCSSAMSLNHPIITTFSEIYIPAKKLEYGIYEVKLTVSSVNIPMVTASVVGNIEIIPTGLMANLISNGTSMITHDSQQNLTLDPGRFSEDPDENEFNSTKWNYTYYCRIHDLPVTAGSSVLMNDNDEINSPNCSCFTSKFSSTESRSSMTIMANSLVVNRTYQFVVNMTHRANPYIRASGYLLVKVENARSQMVAVGCVIATMCSRKGEFQYINPNTQLALFSSLMNQTGLLNNITWNVYTRMMNSSSDTQKWSLFTNMNDYRDIWFFGANRSHFTATNQLFLTYRSIKFWRFEVVYISMAEKSSSALHFEINQPPKPGICSITPSNGTITTKFTVICKDWTDQDGIKDYSFYAWTTHVEQRVILGSTINSLFELRLPIGCGNASLVNVIVQIRDQLNSVTEANISAVSVVPTRTNIDSFVKAINISSTVPSKHPLVEILSKNNSVLTGQVITTVSQVLNEMNTEIIRLGIQNIASIFVSPLGSRRISMSSHSWNTSTFNQYIQQLNDDASVREYLMKSMKDLVTTTWNNILLHASSLVLLTHAINELTRDTFMLASSKCRDMAITLESMARMVSSDDVKKIGNQLVQCAANVLSAVNVPLQQRGTILELDLNRSSATSNDYDDDMYLNLNLNGINFVNPFSLYNLCYFDLIIDISDDGIHKYFINNNRTAKHRFVIVGLRELNTSEVCSNKSLTPPITDQPFNFSANYELRTFTSACYYLDSNNNWQSDGLLVGPMTDHYQTQCFSTHLSTFTSGYSNVPNPVLLSNDRFGHIQNSCLSFYVDGNIVNALNLSKSNTISKFNHEMLSLMPSHLEHHYDTICYQMHETNINQEIAIE